MTAITLAQKQCVLLSFRKVTNIALFESNTQALLKNVVLKKNSRFVCVILFVLFKIKCSKINFFHVLCLKVTPKCGIDQLNLLSLVRNKHQSDFQDPIFLLCNNAIIFQDLMKMKIIVIKYSEFLVCFLKPQSFN